jgi:hypothetical protein
MVDAAVWTAAQVSIDPYINQLDTTHTPPNNNKDATKARL